jgi:hypothetical protein
MPVVALITVRFRAKKKTRSIASGFASLVSLK